MRDLFPEYYTPTKEEFETLWKECIFVFDANILLDLYRISPEARADLLEQFHKFADRIWIPYQVAYEYQKRRQGEIIKKETVFNQLQNLLNSIEKTGKNLQQSDKRHPFLKIDSIITLLTEFSGKLREELDCDERFEWFNQDTTRAELDNLFDGKVGNPYSDEELDKIIDEGEIRYQQEIPPGYKDTNKDKNDSDRTQKYGDLIIWFQILDYAEHNNTSVVFVTADSKGDWWWNDDNGKTIGRRVELIREFNKRVGKDQTFFMYNRVKFIEHAKKYIHFESKPETDQELKELEESRLVDEVQEEYTELVNELRRAKELRESFPPNTTLGELAEIDNRRLNDLRSSVAYHRSFNENIAHRLEDFNNPTFLANQQRALEAFSRASENFARQQLQIATLISNSDWSRSIQQSIDVFSALQHNINTIGSAFAGVGLNFRIADTPHTRQLAGEQQDEDIESLDSNDDSDEPHDSEADS